MEFSPNFAQLVPNPIEHTQVWPYPCSSFDRMCAERGRRLTSQTWGKLGRLQPKLGRKRRTLPNFGPESAMFEQFLRPQTCVLVLAKVAANSRELGQS